MRQEITVGKEKKRERGSNYLYEILSKIERDRKTREKKKRKSIILTGA